VQLENRKERKEIENLCALCSEFNPTAVKKADFGRHDGLIAQLPGK